MNPPTLKLKICWY